MVDNADQLLVNDVVGNSEQLIEAQRSDPTLVSCWEMAKANKGNYVVDHGLLFTTTRLKVRKFVRCVCLSTNVIPYFSWPMILYLEVILPNQRLMNAFVYRFTGQSCDRVLSSM